jgi:hypothetical protein
MRNAPPVSLRPGSRGGGFAGAARACLVTAAVQLRELQIHTRNAGVAIRQHLAAGSTSATGNGARPLYTATAKSGARTGKLAVRKPDDNSADGTG